MQPLKYFLKAAMDEAKKRAADRVVPIQNGKGTQPQPVISAGEELVVCEGIIAASVAVTAPQNQVSLRTPAQVVALIRGRGDDDRKPSA